MLIYNKVKTYGYNITYNGNFPVQINYNEVNSWPYQFQSYKKVDYNLADLQTSFQFGSFALISESMNSRVDEQEVNKVKVKTTYYSVSYVYRIGYTVNTIYAQNQKSLYSIADDNKVMSFNGIEAKSEAEAKTYFESEKKKNLTDQITGAIRGVIGTTNAQLSDRFDFFNSTMQITTITFKKWDKDDEYNGHVKSISAIISNITSGEKPAVYLSKMQPDITYFQSFENTFKPEDKKEDVLYYGNYLNLAAIYFSLDDFSKSKYYIAKLDSSKKNKGLTSLMNSFVTNAKKRMAKHVLTSTHLDYNPATDFRLQAGSFSSDLNTQTDNEIASLDGGKPLTDTVKLADGTEIKGKVIYFVNSTSLKLVTGKDEKDQKVLTPDNTNSFNKNKDQYLSVKAQEAVGIQKYFMKVLYSSPGIVLVQHVGTNLSFVDQELYVKRTAETSFYRLQSSSKKKLAEYFKDCEGIAQKAKDGNYLGGIFALINTDKIIQMCKDYDELCTKK